VTAMARSAATAFPATPLSTIWPLLLRDADATAACDGADLLLQAASSFIARETKGLLIGERRLPIDRENC